MALLILEAIGPRGEELALQAGSETGIPVGWDSEFESATFDSDDLGDDELKATIFEALSEIETDWEAHLKLVE